MLRTASTTTLAYVAAVERLCASHHLRTPRLTSVIRQFLAKWQDEALAELHAELQALTQHVAAARKDNAEVRRLASAATRGAPALGAFEKSIASGTLDGIVAPALLAALRARTAMAAQAALEDLLDEEAPGVRRSAVRRYSERRG